MLDAAAGFAAVESPRGASVGLSRLCKSYDGVDAVKDLSLQIRPGEFLTLLGPSGSGKTTTLSAVAGFVQPTRGEITIGDRRVDHLPPEERNIGVVFQHYALFPHMTAAENVAFPLRMRSLAKDAVRRRVAATLEAVRMEDFAERFPDQLSGGQQQRVALARAMVFGPPVMLLDEPLGALDKNLREDMQMELRRLHRQTGITMIYVTHDQEEALLLSDRIAVMCDGRIRQVDTPDEIYRNPLNRFVAEFVGESNFVDGAVVEGPGDRTTVRTRSGAVLTARPATAAPGAAVSLMIRPEQVALGAASTRMANRLRGRIVERLFIGSRLKLRIALASGEVLCASVQNVGSGDGSGRVGEEVLLGWREEDARIFPRSDGH